MRYWRKQDSNFIVSLTEKKANWNMKILYLDLHFWLSATFSYM